MNDQQNTQQPVQGGGDAVLIEFEAAHRVAFQAAAAFRPSYFGPGFRAHNWVVEAIRSAHIDGQRFACGLPPAERTSIILPPAQPAPQAQGVSHKLDQIMAVAKAIHATSGSHEEWAALRQYEVDTLRKRATAVLNVIRATPPSPVAQPEALPVPLGYVNAGHLHEMQQGRLSYAYLYQAKEVGASVPVFAAPQPAAARVDNDTALLDALQLNPEWQIQCVPKEEPEDEELWQITQGEGHDYRHLGRGSSLREAIIDARLLASPQEDGGTA